MGLYLPFLSSQLVDRRYDPEKWLFKVRWKADTCLACRSLSEPCGFQSLLLLTSSSLLFPVMMWRSAVGTRGSCGGTRKSIPQKRFVSQQTLGETGAAFSSAGWLHHSLHNVHLGTVYNYDWVKYALLIHIYPLLTTSRPSYSKMTGARWLSHSGTSYRPHSRCVCVPPWGECNMVIGGALCPWDTEPHWSQYRADDEALYQCDQLSPIPADHI